MLSFWDAALSLLAVIALRYILNRVLGTQKLPLPPGPPSLPVIGHLFEVIGEAPWKHFALLAETYGDVMHLRTFGQDLIIVSSPEVTSELFEKRHEIYSDRPTSTMLNEIMGVGWIFALWDYGEPWRRARKLFYTHFSASATRKYIPMSSHRTLSFMQKLRDDPQRFMVHCRHVVAFTELEMIYGLKIAGENDEMLVAADNWLEGFNTAGQPGRYLVDFIPALKYLPKWLPGTGFKRRGEFWRLNAEKIRTDAFNRVKASLKTGTEIPCIALTMLEDMRDECIGGVQSDDVEVLVRDTCATAYSAAIDSTTTVLQGFFLAMAMRPEVQKKARRQLDAIIGQSSLPTTDDRASLPYIEAILKETLRWKPLSPISMPRRTSKDDVYRGYFIPKGSVVIPNSWKMLLDPHDYPEPEHFKPERFLRPDGSINPDVRDPKTMIFGYGRRVCPGADFASRFIFHVMACVLHTFDISPPLADDGTPVRMVPLMREQFATSPEPFNCRISVRSSVAASLIATADDT
ncbi:cytochrome P450 [Panus rudis PR-1116 ss-1]|nr:cytochrome P450 [Panus rudis PR-1116 ss-1]